MPIVSEYSDLELSKQILILEHVIKRSKTKLTQLRQEENKRMNMNMNMNTNNSMKEVVVNG
ncbi:gp199 [Bacillus phage W.Ph.]|uniref:Gp199 n=1 Tax=Bacillus phage W.Ph. TaxID=764595 RepID=G9B1V0_9CAUD|nr:gp199 [Bacillus phage W.Ph.]ADH03345.1 gp199 [Bacillus phage W.Ph.]